MKFSIAALLKKKTSNIDKSIPKNRVNVGLDIGRSHVNAVQILQTPDSTIIEKYVHKPVTMGMPLAPQLKNLFSSAQISAKKVRVSVKGQGVILRFITFPRMEKEEFESAIQYEAEKYLPFAVSEVVLDFYIIPTTPGKPDGKTMDVVLVAARKQEVLKLVKVLEEAGLQAEFVDVDAIAFTNAFVATNPESKNKVHVLIDFGAKDANVNIVDHGVLRFSRDITFGGHDVTQILKRKLQIDETQAYAIQSGASVADPIQIEALRQSFASLIQEIKTSINYFYGQHADVEAPEAIFVSGGLAKVELLGQGLEKDIKIPVKQWNPLDSFAIGSEVKKDEFISYLPYLPVSIGLALR